MKRVFEWDAQKAANNIKKHGVSFEDAALVFRDILAASEPDRATTVEERWKTIGLSAGCLLLVVVHTIRLEAGKEVIRIISARRVTKEERRRYEHGEI